MKDFQVVMSNLFNIVVCTNGTEDEALEWVKLNNEAGTTLNWCRTNYEKYPQKKPVKCKEKQSHTHFMFMC